MGIFNKGRVNIVITNRVLRYSYHKSTSIKSLVKHGEVELPEGTIKDGTITSKQSLQKVVNRLVKKNKWKRKKLYFCMQDDTVVIRQLQIPATLTKDEAIGYVKTQIGNSLYLPFGNPSLAIEFLETDGENRDILLFAYPKDKIESFKDIFDEADLKPVAADLTSLSVYRFYYYLFQESDINHVLQIHWNHDALVLTAFQNHKAIFTRYMKLPTNQDQSGLDETLGKQIIDDYIIEINRFIDFYQYSLTKGTARISLLLLAGDFPFLDDVKKALSDAVTIKLYKFPDGKLQVKYADVLGLALKQDS